MTNWRERAEQHISNQKMASLEAKTAQEERLRALEVQRAREIQALWEALNVPQELRKINRDLWNNMGEVVAVGTSAVLRL